MGYLEERILDKRFMEEDCFKEILLERMKTSVNLVVKFCDVLKIVDSTFVSAFLTLSECSTHC